MAATSSGPNVPRASETRLVAVTMLTSSAATLPFFLVSASAVPIQQELGIGEALFGVSVAAFFLGIALSSRPLGRVADAAGFPKALRLAGWGAAAICAVLAVGSRTWLLLAVLLFLAGGISALAQGGGNRALARIGGTARQGLRFGFKQAAIPASGLIAGLAVPGLVATVGWRGTFGVAAAAILVLGTWVSASVSERRLGPRPIQGAATAAVATGTARGRLVLLIAAFALATAAGSATLSFIVVAAVDSGVPGPLGALILALGSGLAALAQIAGGWLADYRHHRILTMSSQGLALSGVGFLLLALGQGSLPIMLAGVSMAIPLSWGWTSMTLALVARRYVTEPAAAAGALQGGGAAGAVLGPAAFGVIVSVWDYRVAWVLCAVSVMLAAGCLFRASRSDAWAR